VLTCVISVYYCRYLGNIYLRGNPCIIYRICFFIYVVWSPSNNLIVGPVAVIDINATPGKTMGHAGAIINGGGGTAKEKIEAL